MIKDDIRIKFKRLVHDDEFYNILFQFFKILIRNSDQKEISLKISKIHSHSKKIISTWNFTELKKYSINFSTYYSFTEEEIISIISDDITYIF